MILLKSSAIQVSKNETLKVLKEFYGGKALGINNIPDYLFSEKFLFNVINKHKTHIQNMLNIQIGTHN